MIVEDFFSRAELDPCRDAIAEQVEDLAQKLFAAGKIKSRNHFNPSDAEATFDQSARVQTIKPCTHWIALAEYSQMSTHVPGFQLFFQDFFATFCVCQISHQHYKGYHISVMLVPGSITLHTSKGCLIMELLLDIENIRSLEFVVQFLETIEITSYYNTYQPFSLKGPHNEICVTLDPLGKNTA